ncbi:MAG: fatty acid oxidation complex subunit alpha FadJ, partial [bacterium]|nr:fatty acid oxidation complex subunit alpha FadJ [bacterium]
GARLGQAVFARIAELKVPSVCAINGVCLGGGTELALACSFRIASDDRKVKIGLPEVQLGIIPGFGGTQRMPRLIGLQQSLGLILTGRQLDARKARKIGLIDLIVPASYLEREAVRLLKQASDRGIAATVRSIRSKRGMVDRMMEEFGPLRRYVLGQARKRTAAKADPENYPAPHRAIEAIEAAFTHEPEQGFDREARILGELVPTRTS